MTRGGRAPWVYNTSAQSGFVRSIGLCLPSAPQLQYLHQHDKVFDRLQVHTGQATCPVCMAAVGAANAVRYMRVRS
jgi:hypothetical protein